MICKGFSISPSPIRMLFNSPSDRMISLIAMVRIKRLVQKGMVIRNSHKARCRAGRVAMNQAVGKPTAKVKTVVRSESLTERHRMVRWASSSRSVPSKTSRENRIPVQASQLNPHSTLPYSPGIRKE